ncbi:MAG TPA: cyclic lactone autoinducer peptide [Clostridiales bacterium]|nr:cyclic lactone autoinducer peptide [Clostridiales bacterium]
MKRLVMKFRELIASFALATTAMNVNQTCMCWIHQPELPQGAEKLRKF